MSERSVRSSASLLKMRAIAVHKGSLRLRRLLRAYCGRRGRSDRRRAVGATGHGDGLSVDCRGRRHSDRGRGCRPDCNRGGGRENKVRVSTVGGRLGVSRRSLGGLRSERGRHHDSRDRRGIRGNPCTAGRARVRGGRGLRYRRLYTRTRANREQDCQSANQSNYDEGSDHSGDSARHHRGTRVSDHCLSRREKFALL